MVLSLVFFIEITAIYLAVVYWKLAASAGQSAAGWALGVGIGYSAVLWVVAWILTLLPFPDFLQIQLAFVLWFVLTLAIGIKTDSIFDGNRTSTA